MIEQKDVMYGDQKLRCTVEDDTYWFAIKDIAEILGAKNPRQLVDTYCNKEEEKKFPGKDTRGRSIDQIHINKTNLMALLHGCSYEAKLGLLAWLNLEITSMPKSEPKVSVGAAYPLRKAENTPNDETRVAASRSRKPKPAKMLAISKCDYIALSGKSKSSVYDRVKNGLLPVKKVHNTEYIWLTDRDEEYYRISKILETGSTETGIVAESICTFLGRRPEE